MNTNVLDFDIRQLIGLPKDLLTQLNMNETDKQNLLILDVIAEHQPAHINNILIGIYKKTGVVEKRSRLVGRLYRLAKRGYIQQSNNKRGVYEIIEKGFGNE